MTERLGDTITVTGIRGRGLHGVLDHERRDGQEFAVDVELVVDLARAGRSDDLAHTVNYAEVAADVLARIEGEPVDLVETLAELVAQDALARPLIEAVTVTVHKPQAPVGVPFEDVIVRVHRRGRPSRVAIGLGANLGHPVRTLEAAAHRVVALADLTDVVLSPWFETDPVGPPDQPAYVNGVLLGRTRTGAAHLLRVLHEVEADFGRTRGVRWGARTLDLDLLQHGSPGAADEVGSDDADLLLPHPRAHERAFVLVPWAAADPGALLRVGLEVRAVADLLADTDTSGVRPLHLREG
ncbi:MAG TPA: 2-amino-4-hydroxy-6-hydroxymethyldihydropteridine diphosphokinase [Dermatophilaceae bacterium]|nr:2-amino-4-hydroxy-6-hydroxymethyldihydropteridine diphosphokinase [Dermatophilaceae bacterium]